MKTFVYHLAEKIAGRKELERFAHPIHIGLVTAPDVLAAYALVVEDLRPTLADHPLPLEARFEEMAPPRVPGPDPSRELAAGVWRHRHPLDMEITFGDDD